MHDLTAFERDLLWVIAGYDDANGPPKGLRIKEQLAEYRGAEINHGRLYPALDHLTDAGLVKKDRLNKRANTYRLAEGGRRELTERLDWEIKQAVAEVVDNSERVSHV